ncbi:hypothetical protein CLOSTHATH_00184 [Hungatella hathewayi DSM 13479]|uniref:Uncharacterized protein n=1 Tax=Hungatella hathewayi DSM 13479 TaxID=566550 RepID=D3A9B4_9FIRM|nr:hypothetical protein CLOSTHATH_00184 [Hungatella hathewayi DSM 13479]
MKRYLSIHIFVRGKGINQVDIRMPHMADINLTLTLSRWGC